MREKIRVSKEKLDTLRAMNEAVKGTTNYTLFHMMIEQRDENESKYHFVGYGVPYTLDTGCYIKEVKGNFYLYREYLDVWTRKNTIQRFSIDTDLLKAFFGIGLEQ